MKIHGDWVQASRTRMVTKKRSYSKKKYGKKKKQKIINALGNKQMLSRPLTNSMPVSLHYSTRVALNPGVGGLAASYVFRLSSIHDPDFTGVGHQPVGHDQVSPLFERYQVWKVDFHVEFVNRSTTQNQRVGYRVSDVSSGSTDADVNIENGNCEWGLISSTGDRRIFQGSVPVYEIHGLGYQQYMSNDDYGAAFGANPGEEGYFIVWADGLGDDTDPVDCCVHLVYHTKLMGNKLTALS